VPDAEPPGADFEGLLRALHEADVEHILVGGAAATAHGSTRLTLDVDVVYTRSAANPEEGLEAIAELEVLREERGKPGS
jgi:hypothetical protein